MEVIELTETKLVGRVRAENNNLKKIEMLMREIETLRVNLYVDPGVNTTYFKDEELALKFQDTPVLPDTTLDAVFECDQTGGLLTSDSFHIIRGKGHLYPGVFYIKLAPEQRVKAMLTVVKGNANESSYNKSFVKFFYSHDDNKSDIFTVKVETIGINPVELWGYALKAIKMDELKPQ